MWATDAEEQAENFEAQMKFKEALDCFIMVTELDNLNIMGWKSKGRLEIKVGLL